MTRVDSDDMTIGEVGRRLVRIETKLDSLADASSRIERLEDAAKTADARAWQTRLALIVAILSMPISIAGGIITAVVLKSAP